MIMNGVTSPDEMAATRLPLGGFLLNLEAGELYTADGELAGLRKQALDVLLALGRRPGQVVSKDELIQLVWPNVVVSEGSLTQAIADIRRVLGDSEHLVVRNVARRGYMLAAEMAAPAAPGHPQARPWTRHPKLAVGSALSAMLLAAALWVALSWPFGRVEVSNLPSLSIAVLPLAAEGSDADSSWFADALHGDLTAELGQLSGTSVTSRETAATFKGKPLDPRAVARELQVRYVVQGSVRREATRVGLRLTMFDGETGTQHWTERFEMDRAELGPSLIDIARRVARSLSVQMYRSTGERSARLAPEQARADDLAMEGFSIYFRGVTPENLKLAGERFDTALRLDPHSVRAWGGIQTINGVAGALAWIPRDRAVSRLEDAARRLNELDQDHYFTHSARLFVAFLKGDWEAQLMLSATATERFASHPAPYNLRALAQAGRSVEELAREFEPSGTTIRSWRFSSKFSRTRTRSWPGRRASKIASAMPKTCAWPGVRSCVSSVALKTSVHGGGGSLTELRYSPTIRSLRTDSASGRALRAMRTVLMLVNSR